MIAESFETGLDVIAKGQVAAGEVIRARNGALDEVDVRISLVSEFLQQLEPARRLPEDGPPKELMIGRGERKKDIGGAQRCCGVDWTGLCKR